MSKVFRVRRDRFHVMTLRLQEQRIRKEEESVCPHYEKSGTDHLEIAEIIKVLPRARRMRH